MTGAAVDLWLWHLDADGADTRVLSDDELARAARFAFDRDRTRYIAGRARLRRILGEYLDRAPRSVVLSYGPNGKPGVDGIEFNLSHTGGLALLAVSADLPLGVDIEAIRPIGMDVAEAHFAPAELLALKALPEGGRIAAFHRCWTRKEAYLKARGTGLSTDLASFTVSLDPGGPALLLDCRSGERADWTLLDLAPQEGVAGALAVRSCGRAVVPVWRARP